jgi:hypothetical protein
MTQSSKPVSPVTGRFAGLSSAALKVLGHSGARMAERLLSAVPQNVKNAAAENPGSPVNLISNLDVQDIFIRSIALAYYVFAELAPAIQVPNLESLEQADVDFVKLSDAYEAYGKEGLEPELVLGPVNLSLECWKQIYANLGAWQDINDPRSPYKLRGGLWVLDYIGRRYREIIEKDLHSLPGKRIITTGEESCAITGGGAPTGKVVWQTAVIPAGENIKKGNIFKEETGMTIGDYLTIQAERMYLKKSPIDKTSCTKLGIINAGENNSWIPLGNFSPVTGQVCLYGYEIKSRRQSSDKEWGNIRIPVWG